VSYNNLALNRLFTQYIFEDLITNYKNSTYCTVVQRYLKDDTAENNGELISNIYKYMLKNYRNEYFYQNTLLNKLLLGRHSLNTTTALTQVPIGKSKADFVMINGKAVVYEIKTELDSFERLNTQLADYYRAFNHVCVVTCEDNYEKLSAILQDTPVGICILSNRNTLQIRKEPQESNVSLSYEALFKVLRKREFESIILDYYGNLPEATPVFFYDECFKWFSKISLDEVYLMVLKMLKKRNRIIKEYFFNVPYELKSLMYFYNATQSDYTKLEKFLHGKYRG
jgi:hypothetical protein